MSDLPKGYDPSLVEAHWYQHWEEGGFFRHKGSKGPYSIVIPPPNVTGVLHMGHALVDTLQDILIRWKRMEGYEAIWVPGTDHAGIATQAVVERNLYAATGKRRNDFSREEFLRHVWEWKERSETHILNQVRRLGCSCDWSRLRFTMEPSLSRAVRACFKRMFDDGLIYRGHYLVNWDPVTQTALSDDEVEHEEIESSLWQIRYPLADGSGELIVATTRPETMLGDTAVAVHPEDERYQKFVGKMVLLPLVQRKIPVIADSFVDPAFGTGAVKLTPAHDFNDFEAAKRNSLEAINILTPDARISLEGPFKGMTVEEARKAVVVALKKGGFLIKVEPHRLRVGISYRSKAVIQPYLSKQWFIRMSDFKEPLLKAVREKRVHLTPSHWEETYNHWIHGLRDWCISRQIWWGHQIPIWYDRENEENIFCYDGEGVPPEVAKDPERYYQDPDVLDTWFSSALWPFSVFGWPEKTPDLERFYPTSTLVTGHDILFFWVARMILMGTYAMKQVPFKEVFLHGLIYGKSYWRTDPAGHVQYLPAEEKRQYDLGAAVPPDVESRWEKMSKSKGNVIDPIQIIQEYGTDALRMALASSTTFARQIDLDLRRFEEFKHFANKVWNGARFAFLNLETLSTDELKQGLNFSLFGLEDHWILSKLGKTTEELHRALAQYAFDRAATSAYEFFWNDFCANYIEAIKPTLFGKQGTEAEKKNKQKILAVVLCASIRLMHPIAPFITEEIFSILKERFGAFESDADPYTNELAEALSAPACIVAPYPSITEVADCSGFEKMLSWVKQIRNLRAQVAGLPPQEKTSLYVSGEKGALDFLLRHQNLILALTPTEKIEVQKVVPKGSTSMTVDSVILSIPIPESLLEKERVRLKKEIEKTMQNLLASQTRLQNEEFRSKAPTHVIAKLEETIQKNRSEIDWMQSRLEELLG